MPALPDRRRVASAITAATLVLQLLAANVGGFAHDHHGHSGDESARIALEHGPEETRWDPVHPPPAGAEDACPACQTTGRDLIRPAGTTLLRSDGRLLPAATRLRSAADRPALPSHRSRAPPAS